MLAHLRPSIGLRFFFGRTGRTGCTNLKTRTGRIPRLRKHGKMIGSHGIIMASWILSYQLRDFRQAKTAKGLDHPGWFFWYWLLRAQFLASRDLSWHHHEMSVEIEIQHRWAGQSCFWIWGDQPFTSCQLSRYGWKFEELIGNGHSNHFS